MPVPRLENASTPAPSPWQANANLQWAATLAVCASALVTVRPLGTSGWALATALLLPLNCLLLLARHLPARFLPDRVATVWLTVAALASAALIASAEEGTAYLFAFFLAGHAGLRLRTRPAATIAALISTLSVLVLVTGFGPGDHRTTPWIVGLTTGLPVLIGMVNRSQRQAVISTLEAARSAERAAQAEARSALLAERARIARDVHDVLAHSLAGVNMQLELADALLETGDLERVRAANAKAHSLVKDSLQQAQWTVHALREDVLPLTDTLTAMLDSSGHHDVLTITGEAREVPAAVVQNLLRIAQESLTNAARHAPGGPVHVELDHRPQHVRLRVTNAPATRAVTNGTGSGMGLVGMRERVALLRGTITAGPVTEGPDAGGWRVEAEVPA
ncbi:signal transduction histidine kinase [Kineosporia succinea]|uniref:histidine kinase n=1 Tax=Kineosporia succinea TaxID=84632 RepID=A0ABT9P5Y4_9ACTN|nr:histidine kinase [Kineosporia succinea]MDP9828112.1 signal transduction histidine kinase [Kineosporia succinea]